MAALQPAVPGRTSSGGMTQGLSCGAIAALSPREAWQASVAQSVRGGWIGENGRVSVPAAVREFLADRHPEVLELALWVREVVLAAEPDLTERVYQGWDGIGFRHPEAGYICAIYPRGAEVRLLFEHGVRLDDPDGLLEGAGNQTRHVTVRTADDLLAENLARLVSAAVGERLFRR
jgi:hypothetical protein